MLVFFITNIILNIAAADDCVIVNVDAQDSTNNQCGVSLSTIYFALNSTREIIYEYSNSSDYDTTLYNISLPCIQLSNNGT